MIRYICIIICLVCSKIAAEVCIFTPPKGWNFADPSKLSAFIKVGFVGKGNSSFKPSLNMAEEDINIDEQEYLKAVKELHAADKTVKWQLLGKIQTKGGEANLAEIDSKTTSGEVKMLQLILVKEKKAYILTGAALKEEFASCYKDFLATFKSVQTGNNLSSFIAGNLKQQKLETKLKEKQTWEQLQKFIESEFKEMSPYWQLLVIKEFVSQNKTE